MTFDPTFDYASTNLTDDNNLVRWEFCELIKSLITISLDAAEQEEIIGVDNIAEQMVMNFECYSTHQRLSYIEAGLLTVVQQKQIRLLEYFLRDQEDDKDSSFWDDEQLATNKDWKIAREKAFEILKSLGMDDITLEFYREEQTEMTSKGKEQVQYTITRLVR